MIGDLRQEPEVAISVRVDVRGEGTARAGLYRIRPDLFLFEEVSDTGLHHFVFHSLERVAGRLVATLDPSGAADRTGPPQSATHVSGLDPHPDQLAASARTSALVYLGVRGGHATGARRSFTCYGGPEGAWVLSGWEGQGEGEGQVSWQRLGSDDLAVWCRSFISRAVETDPAS